jgi:hypothetical protein
MSDELAPNPKSKSPTKRRKRERLDFLDVWQYQIFRVIVFFIFLVYAAQFLDYKIHVTKLLQGIWRYLKSLLP